MNQSINNQPITTLLTDCFFSSLLASSCAQAGTVKDQFSIGRRKRASFLRNLEGPVRFARRNQLRSAAFFLFLLRYGYCVLILYARFKNIIFLFAKNLDSTQTNDKVMKGDQATAGLGAVAEILRRRVKHIYNVPLDCEGFYADDASISLVRAGLAITVEEAVALGLSLEKLGFIKNMKGGDKFRDARLFFSFAKPGSHTWATVIDDASDLLFSKLEPEDHKYHRRTYKDTFLGSEVINLLMVSGVSSSRDDALLFGRAIAHTCNLFRHVANDHILEDKPLFYVFNPHTKHKATCTAHLVLGEVRDSDL
jgi:hypothetical protein